MPVNIIGMMSSRSSAKRVLAFLPSLLVACSNAPSGVDSIAITASKTTVAADSTDKATVSITARNTSNVKFPANTKLTLTTSGGFLNAAGTTSVEFDLSGTQQVVTADVFCTENASITLRAVSGATTRTLGITCGSGGNGSTSGGSSGGSSAGSSGGTTGSTTGGTTGSVAENKSKITVSSAAKVIVAGGSTTLTATLFAVSGDQLVGAASTIFTTTRGNFLVNSASVGTSVTVDATAGVSSVTLVAPSDGGNITVTASYTDSLGVSRSAEAVVRVVAAGAVSIVLESSAETLQTLGSKATVTATLFRGATPLNTTVAGDAGTSLSVTMSGPNDVGSIATNTGGGTVGSDGRSIVGIETNASGQAVVDLFAGVVGGTATLQFTYVSAAPSTTTTEIISVNVIGPPGLASAQFLDADTGDVPLRIRVRGSIAPNVAMLRFSFKDAQGQPIPDGQPVNFALSESASNDVSLTPPSTTTTNGIATVFLNSGAQAETVTITATASRNGVTRSATSPGIAIVGGVPEYSHLSWSCTTPTMSPPGLALDGLSSDCTLQVADRFSNRVDVGTRVTFRTESGNVESSGVVGDATGSVGVKVRTGDPRPRLFEMDRDSNDVVTNIAEVPALPRFYGDAGVSAFVYPDGSEQLPRLNPASGPLPAGNWMTSAPYSRAQVRRRGVVRFIGIVQGEESFADLNGNKVYDPGEPFIDMAEPFVDKNDNGLRDDCLVNDLPFGYDFSDFPVTVAHSSVELTAEDFYACVEDFIDLNGNGVWDDGNGVWDAYTTLWKSHTVTWSGVPDVSLYPLTNNSSGTIDVESGNIFTDAGAMVTSRPLDVARVGSGANNVIYPLNFRYTGLVSGHNYILSAHDENENCVRSGDLISTLGSVIISGTALATPTVGRRTCDWVIGVADNTSTPRKNTSTPPVPERFSSALEATVKVPFLNVDILTSYRIQWCPLNDDQAPPDGADSTLCDLP